MQALTDTSTLQPCYLAHFIDRTSTGQVQYMNVTIVPLFHREIGTSQQQHVATSPEVLISLKKHPTDFKSNKRRFMCNKVATQLFRVEWFLPKVKEEMNYTCESTDDYEFTAMLY
ncbi:hypothetical protein Tcan_00967, partial [Toxocara canis]